jgi:hypothetical protein
MMPKDYSGSDWQKPGSNRLTHIERLNFSARLEYFGRLFKYTSGILAAS